MLTVLPKLWKSFEIRSSKLGSLREGLRESGGGACGCIISAEQVRTYAFSFRHAMRATSRCGSVTLGGKQHLVVF
jgi:hypothetical protein